MLVLSQGLGGPCCARVLTNWWASGERGTYWGMWNIAHNVGGFLAPIIVGTVATNFGWRWGLWTPGIIGLVVGLMVLFAVKDNPTMLGYPAVEDPGQDQVRILHPVFSRVGAIETLCHSFAVGGLCHECSNDGPTV